MAEPLIIEEVEPFYGDTLETAGYLSCDFCEEACWNSYPDLTPLKIMYRFSPGGEVICEHCLGKYLEEKPQ